MRIQTVTKNTLPYKARLKEKSIWTPTHVQDKVSKIKKIKIKVLQHAKSSECEKWS